MFQRLQQLAVPLVLSLMAATAAAEEGETEAQAFVEARAAMVEAVELQARLIGQETGIAELDEAVLEVMRQVPRHRFLPPDLQPGGYLNMPLPAMPGATVSQPLIVALMLHAAALSPDEEALVVGVGAGYLTTLLLEIGASVRVVEYDQAIASYAANRFDELGYGDVNMRIADGYYGWPEAGQQFDAIIVRLALPDIPPTLTAQLAPGGRLIVPVGQPEGQQWLTLVERAEDTGELHQRRLLQVRFTPLPGGIRL
ncbi:MAG TPA: protein-L-isoaspartate O-methyltransferase [Kiloniellales bacterium]|nr:protein-L-isoaspartate O-methyltransferase [Kiloniellales bacterium]